MDIHTATEVAYKNGYEKGRTKAIKEFAERLKDELSFGRYIQFDQIDSIAKEMAGGTDG